jgi:hypothetical protein
VLIAIRYKLYTEMSASLTFYDPRKSIRLLRAVLARLDILTYYLPVYHSSEQFL